MTNRARVLFVDDEKRVLNSMRGMFRREFDLFLASDGAAAVKIASENPIDVIVADQRMPGMTGIEVLGKVKELSPDTIRILLTGYADPTAVEGSINVGEVFRFINKPCPPKVLRETLDLAITATNTQHDALFSQPSRAVVEQPPGGDALDSAVAGQHRRDKNGRARAASDNTELANSPHKKKRHIETGAQTIAHPGEIGVVVYTVCAEFAETAIRTLSTNRNTVLATSLIKVMRTIERNRAGVLITDYTANSARLQRMIGALKQYLPELVTVVVSDKQDTTDMIKLINHGQVFRYILKPVSPQQLRDNVDAAIAKHLRLRINPEETRRHAVASFPDQTEASATLNTVLDGIQELRSYSTGAQDGR